MFNRNQMDMNIPGKNMEHNFVTQKNVAVAENNSSSNSTTFSRVINWCLALVVLVTPILFLPFASEAREFNKQTFVFLAVVVMLGVWVLRIITLKSASWVKTSLDYVLLVYILILLASSWMSIDKVSSFLGYYGRFTGSFLSILSLVVLYYIVVNNVRSARVANKLINILLVSGGLVLVYSLLQMFGVFLIPLSFAKSAVFNPIGSQVGLGIFTAAIILLTQWAWLSQSVSKLKHVLFTIITLAGLLILFLINAFSAWLILAIGMIAFISLSIVMTSGDRNNHPSIWRPLLVLVISILFVAFQFLPSSLNPRGWVGNAVRLPIEIQLSNSASWQMVKNSIAERPVLGFGPGSTGIAFGQIKPDTFNQTMVWNLNFDRSSSEITNIAIETGLLGLIAFEAISILFLIYALTFIMRQVNHPGRMQAFGLFIVWVTLYVSHFFYFYNTTTYFLFWFTLAMFMAIAHWNDKESETRGLAFKEANRTALPWMFGSLLVLAVLLIGGFYQIAVYFADTSYAAGVREINKKDRDLSKVNQSFVNAIKRNPYRDVYYLAYGQNLILQASAEIRKEKPDIQQFQRWIQELINAGNSATSISPNKATNWSARTLFYTQIRSLNVPGTDDMIISSAEEAVKKSDRNPILHLQLSQAYFNAAEKIDPQLVVGTADADADGLSDQNEAAFGSDPKVADTDKDGTFDGDEVKLGYNPNGTGLLSATQIASIAKIDNEKLRKAEESVNRAIDLKNNLPDTYRVKSAIFEKGKKLNEAKKALEDGAKILPNNVDLKYEIGRITFNLKDYNSAETIFKDVIKIAPNHANAHFSLAQVYLQKNDRDAAILELEKTLVITGENTQLKKLIEDLKALPAATPSASPTPITPSTNQ